MSNTSILGFGTLRESFRCHKYFLYCTASEFVKPDGLPLRGLNCAYQPCRSKRVDITQISDTVEIC